MQPMLIGVEITLPDMSEYRAIYKIYKHERKEKRKCCQD
jgi:hypothetical protein